MNQDEWFLNEFGEYGFSLSPTVYDPFDFQPYKVVMVREGMRVKSTNIKITPELANDLYGWGTPPYDYHVEGLRELIRMEIRRQFGHKLGCGDFRLKEKINRFKFI